MGLFSKLFSGNKSQTPSAYTPASSGGYNAPPANVLNMSKEESLNLLNMRKQEVHDLCMVKAPLNGLISRVGLVIDYSGSMSNLYKNGTVQAVIEKILPIAMEFDDNGTMEVWIFESGFHRLPDINLNNYYGYVKREIMNKYNMGGTYYAPVMNDVMRKYIQEDPAKLPTYVIFITDGENSDRPQATATITHLSRFPIFFQFVGVGRENFKFLSHLDEMEGRYVDNANFFKVVNPNDITYNDLLQEYPGWLEYPEVKNMLR